MTSSARLIGGVLVIAGAASPATAATLYVNGTCGNDAWSGTSSTCTAPDGPKAHIQAAITAAGDGDTVLVAAGTYFEAIDYQGKAVALSSDDGPETTIIDGQGSGTVVTCTSGEGPGTLLEGFTITGGFANGGGMYCIGSSPTVRNCIFTGNQADVGAGIRSCQGSSPFIDACSFIDNFAEVAGAGMLQCEGHPVIRNCLFQNNISPGGDAGLVITGNDGTPPTVVNCLFIGNQGGQSGGAIDGGDTLWVNCVFSQNVSGGILHAALVTTGAATVINCTFSGNTGNGIQAWGGKNNLAVFNSIVWDNSLGSLDGTATVYFSDFQGGWAGPGSDNINVDPLFVQAGTNDLRLSIGSPCLDAGDNAALPADEVDLDGDGNTVETLPYDLAGNPRVQSGIVDMGAYEGEFSADNPAASDDDLDAGEFAILIPVGGPFNPLVNPAVVVTNTSKQNDATFLVTQIDWALHPGAGGFSDLGSILQTETTLADGQYTASLFIPFSFDAGEINAGIAPQDVTPTWYDPATGDWAPAVSGNTGPEGQWIYSEDPANWGNTMQVGDWGVFWNPDTLQGFAWANVDHSSDFAIGLSLACVGDCAAVPDGEIGIDDFLVLLASWGPVTPGGPCDVNGDGMIDVSDVFAMFEAWGPCMSESSMPQGTGDRGVAQVAAASAPLTVARSADFDGDGRVGRGDLDVVKAARNKGTVVRDWLDVLAQWDD